MKTLGALALAVVVSGAAAGPLGAQTPPQRSVQVEELRDLEPPSVALRELEQQASQAYAAGEMDRAIELYRRLAEQTPQAAAKAQALVTAAWLFFLDGKSSEASGELERALTFHPSAAIKPDLYNQAFVDLFHDAQPRALAARTRQANDAARAGVQALAAGDRGKARELLTKALGLEPDHPRALYNLAVVDVADGQTEAALAGFQKVASLGQSRPEAVSKELRAEAEAAAGAIYLSRGELEDARTALTAAVQLAPADGASWNYLGATQQRLGDAAAAIAAFERARALMPGDLEVAGSLGRAYSAAQRWAEAVSALREGTRAHPASPRLWLDLGLAERGLGNAAGALEALTRALELDAENRAGIAEPAATFLALVHFEARRYAEAAAAARQALAWNDATVENWIHLGSAEKELGDLAGAARDLERAVALAPQRADAVYNLGTVYLAAHDLTRAEESFRRALALEPGLAPAAEILAKLEAQKAAAIATDGRTGTAPPRPRLFGAKLREVSYPDLGIKGLLVETLDASGAAAAAGLRTSDLLLRADERPVGSPQALAATFARLASGSSVALDVLRAGAPLRLTVRF